MQDFINELATRGFLEQISDQEGVADYLKQAAFAYIGFDPTASSLHAGSLVPIMALAHLQRCGHRPIVLVGGATAMIGDPSGKTELRQMLSKEDIRTNATALQKQLGRFIEFGTDKAIMVNNAEWLEDLNYIDFLREIGRNFSVNRMLAAESYKQRLETGLSFIEFNYMILQAYDFLLLSRKHGCLLQMGGNDQWGNIVAGIDLIRRMESKEAYGLTFPLLTTSSGTKMGKTAQGAVWLDKDRFAPYDYYQYWRNSDDRDVGRFLKLFTFLPLDEIERLAALQGEELNHAKQVLAFEATAICHGKQAAEAAADWKGNMPEVRLEQEQLQAGLPALDAFYQSGLFSSRSEVRRLFQQGGAYLEEEQIQDLDRSLSPADFHDGVLTCRAGKKKYFRLVV